MKRHRNHRNKSVTKLNLVALMDIFTILVFFLMVNTSDAIIKHTHKSLTLPEASTPTLPTDSIQLVVNDREFFIESTKGASADIFPTEVSNIQNGIYPALIAQLTTLESRLPALSPEEQAIGRKITIMSDKAVPYKIMKTILASCAATSYRDISLAITFKEGNQTAALTSNGGDS